jgi:hypothetical protein
MIKVVMGSIMLIVAVSRGLAIPKYLTDLGLITMNSGTVDILTKGSFVIMAVALLTGAVIIISSMVKGMKKAKESAREKEMVTSHGKV